MNPLTDDERQKLLKERERTLELLRRAKLGDEDALDELCSLSPLPTGRQLLVLEKLDVVKRQLETAIMLFFADGDPVSIHTLACAAHGVVRDLNRFMGGSKMAMAGCDLSLINV